jgi:hypothetical protein
VTTFIVRIAASGARYLQALNKYKIIYDMKQNILKPKDALQKIFHKIPWNIIKAPDEICPFSFIGHGFDKSK